MKKRLVTSALPYVNNIPHLGNLIQVLSADVFARYCRQMGYETLYVCGTDEYGTATETKAREEGVSPRELCDRYHTVHRDIYSWFNIQFDHFGRTSTEYQTRIVQDIFSKVYQAGYINQHTIKQLYSEASDMFLADRYVRGTCPHCGYQDARGDQCEDCGKLLDPSELIEPKSILDNTTPVLRETTHLYLDLPKVLPLLQEWMGKASVEGQWARNAIQMTQAWIRDGLKERAITRDLKWGIPVPLEGFEDKVFYVWFDAPIGYVSITAELTDQWQQWWKNPKEVELFQFIGKDNIPFHTVIFPSSLLATGEEWTMLHHMSSSEYLNYESGKFSKSKGIGVFGNDVQDTGIPADVWRFYIFYNRPETSDYVFTWKDFQDKVNKELIGNLANLVNRTLSFQKRFFGGQVDSVDLDDPENRKFWDTIKSHKETIEKHLEWAELRDGLRAIFDLADFGNKVFQENEPWKLRTNDPDRARRIMANLVYLVRDLAIFIRPYLPETSQRISGFLGCPTEDWHEAGLPRGITLLGEAEILFKQLDDDQISGLRERFSGSQAERAARDAKTAEKSSHAPGDAVALQSPKNKKKQKGKPMTDSTDTQEQPKKLTKAEKIALEDKDLTLDQRFTKRVDLRVAVITGVEQHPEADKLYIETLDDGSGQERTIVSGLVPHYTVDELLGKHIILVSNLKAAKLRGVKSHGMLLAASRPEGEGEVVSVIEAPWAEPGTRVVVSTQDGEPGDELTQIDIDTFFDIPLEARDGVVTVGGKGLAAAGRTLASPVVPQGRIG
ncbi:methionine--tRNA ligase [Spirochaeta lutea]|uniref:Methionine--tRNA ligase n=1 Tax=Spirochaeta lutea TaxID=1480694 RepID=A0A098QZK4_9SPIO|nr:methionine--tRNA ligase [Spirochaeta lutea]KGE73144.1 methionyl-tRNA synthetase [Spirochaeta lutea]